MLGKLDDSLPVLLARDLNPYSERRLVGEDKVKATPLPSLDEGNRGLSDLVGEKGCSGGCQQDNEGQHESQWNVA